MPPRTIVSLVSEGELVHITTTGRETYTITHRLHALEARLDPRRFIRISRGVLVNVECVVQLAAMPGGTYIAKLSNGQEFPVSRIQSRLLRETILKL